MATQSPEPIPVPLVDPVATAINQLIDRLILSLEQRRVYLLTQLKGTREEMGANQEARQQMEQELIETRSFLKCQIKHDMLHSMQMRIVGDLEAKLAELKSNEQQPPQEVKFLCDTQGLEEHIARLGEIVRPDIPPIPSKIVKPPIPPNQVNRPIAPKAVNRPIAPKAVNRPIAPDPGIPKYAAFLQPIVVVGGGGSAPGRFFNPHGVSIDKELGHIYVVDMDNNLIQIFSKSGGYLNHFGDEHFMCIWGILVYRNSIYVTDMGRHAISLFKLSDLSLMKRKGKKGSGNRQFSEPCQLSMSPNQLLYVADRLNNRVQILSADLKFQDSLIHPTMNQPVDVKFSNHIIFVLSLVDNPCIHVFSLEGNKTRSLVTRGGIGMQVKEAYFFCLDEQNNIVISDYNVHNIKVFSPAGDLLHAIGREGNETGMFYQPKGIAVNSNKLVCVSSNKKYGLQIFSA